MTRPRALLAGALALALVAALPARARGQGSVVVELPNTDPFPATPLIHVAVTGLNPANGPYSVRLRLALDASFGLLVYDSTQAAMDAIFGTRRLLPENQPIFAEASVLDSRGQVQLTTVRFAGRTGPRLLLLSPVGQTNINLSTRRPTFSWRSARITNPPGPWVYELRVTNVATQQQIVHDNITDSVYVLPDTLQAQTSYRWSVSARLPNGSPADGATANSTSSFVVFPSDEAPITLLYQNFPNPFPAPSSANTCIWFDLQFPATVRLSVLDLRGRRVRTIVPGALGSSLPPGRYGRFRDSVSSGCDPRLTWDGTSDDGRTVPAGVYLLHLLVDGGTPQVKKILFLGH